MKTLEVLQNENLQLNTGKTDLKSTTRNQLKRDFLNELVDYIANATNDNENIEVGRTADGVGVAIYNAQLDETITIVLDATFKKFDYDLASEIDGFACELEEKEQKKVQREKAKQAKIKRDTIEREKKQLERQLAKKVASGEVSAKTVKKVFEN